MEAKSFLTKQSSKAKSILLMAVIICLFLLENKYIASIIDMQYLKSIFWVVLALLVYKLPKVRPKGKIRLRYIINWWAFNFAFIYIVLTVSAGIMDGFGRSPYDHSIKGMVINLFSIGSLVIGREYIRNYLVNSLTKVESSFIFILVALLMTFTEFDVNRFMGLRGYQDIVKFIAQYFVPEFSKSLFVTYLVYLGGPIPGIIYIGIIKVFHWFSPILPDLKWITAAFIGILYPIFFLMIFQNIYLDEARLNRPKDTEDESPFGWITTSLVSIAIIWFAVGTFPIYPSVIATGSMKPMIKPGDVILVKKVTNINNLKVNDVIQFKRDNIYISHRIIEIVDEKGAKKYRTKGDSNSRPDGELVEPKQIKGKIIEVVPKVGWPTLLFKSKKEIPLNEIEF